MIEDTCKEVNQLVNVSYNENFDPMYIVAASDESKLILIMDVRITKDGNLVVGACWSQCLNVWR